MTKIKSPHKWDLTPDEAIQLQKEMAHTIVREDDFPTTVASVAGIDLGYDIEKNISRAVIAVLNFPQLDLIETQDAAMPTPFPYIPGLLSFREIPVLIEAVEKLTNVPDLILYNGVGIAHPRRFGIASHAGVVTGIPSIGVAKSLLVGRVPTLGQERGSTVPIIDRGEQIGTALRTRTGVQPVYVSVGHRISLPTAVEYVLRCTTHYRLPETTRIANRVASQIKTDELRSQPSLF
jgi:deoxyribonuclease V